MFAGMIRVDSKSTTQKNENNTEKCYRCAVRSDSVTLESESRHRRSFRRPGYMRTETFLQVDDTVGTTDKRSCDSHRKSDINNSNPSVTNVQTCTTELPVSSAEKWIQKFFERDESSNSQTQLEETSRIISSRDDVFNSSFSFIQQSLETSDLLDESSSCHINKTSWNHLETILDSSKTSSALIDRSEPFTLVQPSCAIGQSAKTKSLLLDEDLWTSDLDMSWCGGGTRISSSVNVQESDAEVTSTVDSSDSTSSSSVTSGYDSSTPSADLNHNGLRKKCEDVLRDCLRNNHTNAKIKSMMLKLQRLQHRAVLNDDYDAAERFGKKLDDLRRERATLKLFLPSKHPSISEYLHQINTAVQSAIQRTNTQSHHVINRKENRRFKDDLSEDQKRSSISSIQYHTREHLIQEKHKIQKEMCDLQRRLEVLHEKNKALEIQLEMDEHRLEMDTAMLRGCDESQLRLIGRALEDVMMSEHRAQIRASPPDDIIRLQEQEQALSLSIKETTAKMLTSQKLGGSLRRKVSEMETQFLTLQEAKLAAISGNDFSSAKELKDEIRNVCGERERLETLVKKLHTLSTGSGREMTRMKEKQNQIKLDLQRRESRHERSLKESILKYMKLLEEHHHSCECSALDQILEADLEACHLLLKGLELRTPKISETEDSPAVTESRSNAVTFTDDEADCAMLTALGGRWCPEANLQHSEFTKKLEEFLFCVEDAPKDLCEEEVDLMVRCDIISERLHYLEDQLQVAMDNHDKDLILSLEAEVQEVKITLHDMLSQLQQNDEDDDEDDDDDDDDDKYCDVEEEQVDDEEIEEDLYFSDSWDI